MHPRQRLDAGTITIDFPLEYLGTSATETQIPATHNFTASGGFSDSISTDTSKHSSSALCSFGGKNCQVNANTNHWTFDFENVTIGVTGPFSVTLKNTNNVPTTKNINVKFKV